MNRQTAIMDAEIETLLRTAIRLCPEPQPQTNQPDDQVFEVDGHTYFLSIASSRSDRQQAYQFVFGIYRHQGFTDPHDSGPWYSVHNALPRAVTFLVKDVEGRPVASGTVIPDSPFGLPMERMYRDEVQSLRRAGRRVCEINSLVSAAATEGWRGRNIILKVFSAAFWYARHVLGADDLLCVTSPEHARFYRRVLLLDTIGPLRMDPHANGAASLALRLDVPTAEDRYRNVYDHRPGSRNLYRFFAPSAQAVNDLAEWIARRATLLDEDDFLHFFVDSRDLLRDVTPAQIAFLRNAYPRFALWNPGSQPVPAPFVDGILPPIPFLVQYRLTADNRGSLHVDIRRASSAPRPHWWEAIKRFLRQAGFAMDPCSDENDEVFLPASFFHAEIAMRAERICDMDSAASFRRRMEEIVRSSTLADNPCSRCS